MFFSFFTVMFFGQVMEGGSTSRGRDGYFEMSISTHPHNETCIVHHSKIRDLRIVAMLDPPCGNPSYMQTRTGLQKQTSWLSTLVDRCHHSLASSVGDT